MWSSKDNFRYITGTHPAQLDSGIFEIRFSQNIGFFLEKTGDKFEMPKKLYCVDEGLSDHIITAYTSESKPLGALLTGLKGSGKSMTVKQICNTLDLPVVMVNDSSAGVIEFVSGFDQPCIFVFDEFEKVFPRKHDGDKQEQLLSLFDGFTKANHLFLLTANSERASFTINPNFFDRPSRIRYVAQFDELSEDLIKIIILDRIEDRSVMNNLVKYLRDRSVVSVDVVASLCNEVNRFGFDEARLSKWFNLSKKTDEKYVLRDEDNRRIANLEKSRFRVSEYMRSNLYPNDYVVLVDTNETTGDFSYVVLRDVSESDNPPEAVSFETNYDVFNDWSPNTYVAYKFGCGQASADAAGRNYNLVF